MIGTLLLCTLSAVFAAEPVGVSFNETLQGFGVEGGSVNDTIADFEAAYDAGKKLNQKLAFGLYVSIPDMAKFLTDPLRTGVCAGYAEANGLTPATGATVENGGRINIFDGGVLPTHELRMEYTLPFVALDGKNYTLTGVKHIPSKDCAQLASQVTTLYVHVREGYDDLTAKIVQKGIVKIGPAATIKLIASLKVFGEFIYSTPFLLIS
jgi:cholesterol oxidase